MLWITCKLSIYAKQPLKRPGSHVCKHFAEVTISCQLYGLSPPATHRQRIPPMLGPLPPHCSRVCASVALSFLAADTLDDSWAQSHGSLHHVTPAPLLSVPVAGHGKGRQLAWVSWGLEKKKVSETGGWEGLAELSHPSPSYHKCPYLYKLHN